jgi:ribose-phosphate pyrophosphokinase
MQRDRIALFALDSGRSFLERVSEQLGVSPGGHEERAFEDGEHEIRPLDAVRGGDVYFVQSLHGGDVSLNEKLVRTLFFLGALRDAGAARVTAVTPYLCYARSDRRSKPGAPVGSRYVAQLFEAIGLDRIMVVDVHNPAAYENAFRIPAEHLTAAPLLVDELERTIGNQPAVVVSPDPGGVKRAERLRESLARRLGRAVGMAFVEKHRADGVVRGGAVAGDVDDRVAIIVDDLASSGTTLARAAAACRERGARRALAAVTHGVFAAGASDTLRNSVLERLIVTDTIPIHGLDRDLLRDRVTVLDSAPLVASAIVRLHESGSLRELWRS